MTISLSSAFLYVLMIHVFWFFGIHGANVLEPLVKSIFGPAMHANMRDVAKGIEPGIIFTKPFFDTFVMMGGCGATFCLIAVLLMRKKNNPHKKIAFFSLLPGSINANESIIFGIPIVFNIYLLIPFILVPVAFTLISAAAMSLGLVPLTITEIDWTTPIILGGYIATGSVAGSVLQLVNLAVGVLIYMPFINMYEKRAVQDNSRAMNKLFGEIEQLRRQPKNVLRNRNDEIGNLARALSNALIQTLEADEELYLVMQPKVRYDGVVVGAECLLRWDHEQYGSIPPPIVVGVAEDSDCMDELGEWVMRRAIKMQSELMEQGVDIKLSFNVSPLQLDDAELADKMRAMLEEYHVQPEKMVVEITEEAALEATTVKLDLLNEFKALGVQLSMDDFGMGHGSLRYLEEFGLNEIKIDGSIVRSILTKNSSKDIINSIVYLCESMGMDLVAEYVESEQLRDELLALGCLVYQGYYYTKPLRDEEFIAYYRQQKQG
jgi:EAL domain-containing protein (putative c-di-GMP-specific phosphodiesterase class I)